MNGAITTGIAIEQLNIEIFEVEIGDGNRRRFFKADFRRTAAMLFHLDLARKVNDRTACKNRNFNRQDKP